LKRTEAADAQEQLQLRQQIIDASAEADSLHQKMQDEEQQLLDKRTRQSERLFCATVYVLGGAFVVALALFFFHYRLLNTELGAREQAEVSLRNLSARLLELQDQERRKFSRELHDSLGQYLAGVKMNLTMLGNSVPANALISEYDHRNPHDFPFIASATVRRNRFCICRKMVRGGLRER
jgi:signal transduction histidine kinase